MFEPNKAKCFKSVDDKYIYRLEFDSSTNLESAWVDS